MDLPQLSRADGMGVKEVKESGQSTLFSFFLNKTRFAGNDDVLTHNKSTFFIYDFIRAYFYSSRSSSPPRNIINYLFSAFAFILNIKIACTTRFIRNTLTVILFFRRSFSPLRFYFDTEIIIIFIIRFNGWEITKKSPHNGTEKWRRECKLFIVCFHRTLDTVEREGSVWELY